METLNAIRLINFPITHSSSSSSSQIRTSTTHTDHRISLRIFQNPFGPRKSTNYNMGAVFSGQGSTQQPAGGPPQGEPSKSWINWLIGVMLSIVLPFAQNKWTRMLAIKNEVDTIVTTVEMAVEVVEKVAEEVAEVVHEVDVHIPEDGKFKHAVEILENVAKETSKDAHIVDQLIQQVEEVEKEMDSVFAAKNTQKMNNDKEDESTEVKKKREINNIDIAIEVTQN